MEPLANHVRPADIQRALERFNELCAEGADASTKVYRSIATMRRKFDENVHYLEELKGKKVALLVGSTGAGKSTVVNALSDNIELNDNETYDEKEDLGFKIGDSTGSVTRSFNYMKLPGTEDCFIVDCPGLNDSNKFFDLPNMCILQSVIAHADKFVICFIAKGASLDSERGAPYFSQVTAASRLLSDTGIQNASKAFVTLFNKPPAVRSHKSVTSKLMKFIDTINERKDALEKGDLAVLADFNSADFPQVDELDRIAELLETEIIPNFKCIDPMDYDLEKFGDHRLTMKGLGEKLVQMLRQGSSGSKAFFNTDIPYRQHEFLNKEIMRELLQAKNFTQDVLLRDAVNYLLYGMLKYWKGAATDQSLAYLGEQIDFADAAQKNRVFDWYMRSISPWFMECARSEAKSSSFRFDMSFEPITVMLKQFFMTFDKLNEDDLDCMEVRHWEWVIDWYLTYYDKLKTMNTVQLPNIPLRDAEGNMIETGTISFKEALQLLSKADFASEHDQAMKRRWLRLLGREIYGWFEASCPTGHSWRKWKRTQKVIYTVQQAIKAFFALF